MTQFTDNTGQVFSRLQQAKEKALMAMAVEGKALIQEQMMSGYGNPIKKSGNLMGSITYDEPSDDEVHVGTNVEYAPFVHDGTYKMVGRPFVRSAIAGGERALQSMARRIIQREMGE